MPGGKLLIPKGLNSDQIPHKSLHRMLSSKGNPSMDNLAAILSAVSRKIPRARNARQRRVA
jgi:DNA-binding phage protein